MKYKLLLDFDRTLFDTHNFWIDLDILLFKKYGLPPDWLKENYPKFVLSKYDQQMVVFQLLANQSRVPEAELAMSITEMIKNKPDNYLFFDAVDILSDLNQFAHGYEVEILTFGDNQFQAIKTDPGELIRKIPIRIISEPKSEYIKREFSDYRGILIDDKPDQQLPEGWLEINLLRSNQSLNDIYEQSKNVYVINNLHQAQPIITNYKNNKV